MYATEPMCSFCGIQTTARRNSDFWGRDKGVAAFGMHWGFIFTGIQNSTMVTSARGRSLRLSVTHTYKNSARWQAVRSSTRCRECPFSTQHLFRLGQRLVCGRQGSLPYSSWWSGSVTVDYPSVTSSVRASWVTARCGSRTRPHAGGTDWPGR